MKKPSHCVSFLYLWMAAKNALSTREWFCEIESPPSDHSISDMQDKGYFIRKPGSLEGFNFPHPGFKLMIRNCFDDMTTP